MKDAAKGLPQQESLGPNPNAEAHSQRHADIRQAARWMRQGKKVRRAVWPLLVLRQPRKIGSGIEDVDPVSKVQNPLDALDLLAEDWEIVQ